MPDCQTIHFGTPFCSNGLGCQKPVRFGTLALWCVQWRLAVYVCAVNPSASWSWLCTTPSARDKVHRGFFVSGGKPRDLRGSPRSTFRTKGWWLCVQPLCFHAFVEALVFLERCQQFPCVTRKRDGRDAAAS